MQDDTDMDEDFKLLEPMDLITKSVDELRKIIKEKNEKAQKKKLRGKVRRMLTTNENLQEELRWRNSTRKKSANMIVKGAM